VAESVLHERRRNAVFRKQVRPKGFGKEAAVIGVPPWRDQNRTVDVEALKVHC
jgi:hypothetical protein